MAVQQLKTFADIYTAVMEELKIQAGDTTAKNRVKRLVNMAYINEIVPHEKWKWLRGYTDLTAEPKFETGTVSVTEDSTTVTLSSAPTVSKKGYLFSVSGYNEIYRIAQHTASSTTVVLETPYTGETNTAASFSLWTDKIALPSDCREVVKLWHDFDTQPMEGLGLQQFRAVVTSQPKQEGRPLYHSLSDSADPNTYQTIGTLPALSTRASSGLVKTLVFAADVSALLSVGDYIEVSGSSVYSYNGRFKVSSVSTSTFTYTGMVPLDSSAAADASLVVKLQSNEGAEEMYKELLYYPSLNTSRTTLHLDYIRDVRGMEDDTDEPLLPLEDRITLFYLANHYAWSSIGRNPEEAKRNWDLYQMKLMKMSGRVDDSTDFPQIVPSKIYLESKRRGRSRRNKWRQDR